jgi:phosphohistidine phosphatase
MDLILWRHAEAEDGVPDMARALTPKGEKQAAQMARWLREHLPKDTRVLVSPATRAQQTARALTSQFETERAIAPGASFASLLAKTGWPEAKGAVLVVGHQPTLGEVAAMLISGHPSDWIIKKGAIMWLTHRIRGEDQQVVLRATLSPELV